MVFTLVSKDFIRNETSATIARLLICTAALTWSSLALFYGSIVVFGGAPRSFLPLEFSRPEFSQVTS
jgi:hypothetical protein